MTSWVAIGTTAESAAASRFCYDKCNESCDQSVCLGEETKGTAFFSYVYKIATVFYSNKVVGTTARYTVTCQCIRSTVG